MKRNALYPLGFLGLAFINTLFTQWVVYFHMPVGGKASSSIVGLVLLIGYCLQGILNPWIGIWADRTRHRWGRRRPFILLGAWPLALVFYALWLREIPLFLSMGLILLYCILFASVSQPYFSLLPTLAPDQNTRVKYSLIGVILALLASGLAMIGGPFVLQGGSFANLGMIGAVVLIASVWIAALTLREPPKPLFAFKSMERQFRNILSKPKIYFFLMGHASILFVVTSLTILSPYISETLLNKGRAYTSVLNSWLFGGIVISVVIVAVWGKRIVFLRLLRTSALVSTLILMAMGSISFFPVIFSILPLWWLSYAAMGLLVLSTLIAPSLVLAKMADEDGQGREGMFFGLSGMAINLGNALSSQVTVWLLSQGHQPEHPLGIQLGLLSTAIVALVGTICFYQALRLDRIGP